MRTYQTVNSDYLWVVDWLIFTLQFVHFENFLNLFFNKHVYLYNQKKKKPKDMTPQKLVRS